jgi:uncharacterized membrane protein YhaH (DUF805 family)
MGQVDFNKLWQNFLDTVTNHYFDLNGRVGRPQYWYFILVCVGVLLVAAILDGIVHTGLLTALVGLALLLPMAGMSTRRIHDTAQYGQYAWVVWIWVIVSGLYQILGLLLALSGLVGAAVFLLFFFSIGGLLALVNVVAAIAIIFFCAQPGAAGANQYGPEPAVWTPGPAAPATPAS